MCVLWLYPKFWIPIVYTVQSHYRFAVAFHLMPVFNMSLPRLERLTLRANLMFNRFHPHVDYRPARLHFCVLYSPLPQMLQLIKSSPSLKLNNYPLAFGTASVVAPAMSTLSLVPMTSPFSCSWMPRFAWDIGRGSYPSDRILSSIAKCQMPSSDACSGAGCRCRWGESLQRKQIWIARSRWPIFLRVARHNYWTRGRGLTRQIRLFQLVSVFVCVILSPGIWIYRTLSKVCDSDWRHRSRYFKW